MTDRCNRTIRYLRLSVTDLCNYRCTYCMSEDGVPKHAHGDILSIEELADVLRGLDAACAAGFDALKLNVVLMGGVNDDEIADFVALTRGETLCVRFIELMPMGQCAGFPKERFISADAVTAAVPTLARVGDDGVAELYRAPGHRGAVGLIRPLSRCFCAACDRIRVTADGKLKPCLHSAAELPLRGLHGAALDDAIRRGAAAKPARHHLAEGSETPRNMFEIGG